jgi:phosphoribosyl-ATP pyrophosphohydrolase
MAKQPKKRAVSSTKTGTKKRRSKPKRTKRQQPGFDIDFDPVAQIAGASAGSSGPSPGAHGLQVSAEVLNRMWNIIEARRAADPELSHSARLLARGTPRVAQKFGEEASECLIEMMSGNRSALIGESADVLYHLLVAWVNAGVRPEEVWHELQRRERVSYYDSPIKRLLGSAQVGSTKIP